MSHGTQREPIPTSDWEEQDLLTLDEAALRLADELDATREEMAAAGPEGDPARIERLQRRVTALESALARVSARA